MMDRPPIDEDTDRAEIAALVDRFFSAFRTDGRFDDLYEVLLPEAVIVRTCGGPPQVYDVAGFVEPRRELLTGGTLTDFAEWAEPGRTDLCGDVAQHACAYAKSWREDGVEHTGRGAKTFQFVRTADGWRISAAAWDDERPGHDVGPA